MFAFFTITLRFLSVTEWDIPYRDLAEIVRKLHSHRVIFMTLMPSDVLVSSLRLSQEPTIIFFSQTTIQHFSEECITKI